MKKRGLASIVANVLIILIMILGIVILSNSFSSMIKSMGEDAKSRIPTIITGPENATQSNILCKSLNIEVVNAEFTPADLLGNAPNLKVNVTRNSGAGSILKIRFIIADKIVYLDDDNATDLKEFYSKEYIHSYATPQNMNDTDLSEEGHSIKVAPIVLVEGKEVVCTNAMSEPVAINIISD
jgi:hypothetical protein